MAEMKLDIRKAVGFVTNVDRVDQQSNYFARMRGIRNTAQSYLAQRDYGTKHRYATYPSAFSIQNQFTFIDPTTATEYDIVVGVDTSNNMRMFVYDTDPFDATARWTEITQKLTAKVNGTPAATAISANIDTIKDILAATYVPATDQLIKWVVYNSTRGNYVIVGDSTATAITAQGASGTYLGTTSFAITGATNATPIVLTAVGHTFTNGQIVDVQGVEGNTAANGTWEITGVAGNNLTLVSSTGNGAYSANGTVTQGLGWQDNDDLILFRTTALAISYNYSNGTLPHIRFNSIEAVKKLNVYYGSLSSVTGVPTMRDPVQIQRRTETQNYFYNVTTAPLLVYDFADETRWFLDEGGGGLSTFYSEFGSASSPKTTAVNNTLNVTDSAGKTFLKINYAITFPGSTGNYVGLRVKFTLMYDGYEESDPIHTVYMDGTAAAEPVLDITNLFVNPAIFNKRITAINIYVATANDTIASSAEGWTTGDDDFVYAYSLPVKTSSVSAWGTDYTVPQGNIYWADNVVSQFAKMMFTAATYLRLSGSDWTNATNWGSPTLETRLGHPSDTSRSIVQARFAAQVTRTQGSIVVIDEGDATLRLSTYDGDLVHEDDNFPEAVIDNSGNKQKILLTSRDKLNGIGVNQSKIVAFKTREAEVYDLYSQIQDILPVDFLAKRSIVSSPYGLFWAGQTGIYLMPSDGGLPRLINADWQNFYDGSLLTDDGSNPYISSAYRAAIIGGWDDYYQEVWFHCQVNIDTIDGGSSEYLCFRYSPTIDRWNVRQLNIGSNAAVTAFSQRRSDGTFVISYATGVLKYPYITLDNGNEASLRFQDDVTSADATASKGVPTRFLLQLGELSDKLDEKVIRAIVPFLQARVIDGNYPYFTLKVWANKESTAYDTQTFKLIYMWNWDEQLRLLKNRGRINQLAIEGLLDSTSAISTRDLNLSGFQFVVDDYPRGGNI